MSSPANSDNLSTLAIHDTDISNIVSTVEEISPQISNTINELNDIVNNNVSNTVDTISDKVEDIINDNVDSVSNKLHGVLGETVGELVSDTLKNVVDDGLSGITDDIKDKTINIIDDATDTVFVELLGEMNIKIASVEITPDSIMSLVRYAMEVVELSLLKGTQQKEMVIRLIRRVIIDAPISDERELLCLQMLNAGVIGNAIDIIVSATRGELQLNNAVETAVEVVANTKCFGLLNLLTRK